MKKLTFLILFVSINIFSQTNESRINQLRSESKIDSEDKAVFNLLDEFYIEALQSNEGILSSDTSKKLNNLYKNKKTKNRHLLLMFLAYQDHISQAASVGKRPNPKFQLEIMNDLESEFKSIFNNVPAIIIIYKVEALQSNRQQEEALVTINNGLRSYSDSIPLKVYKYLSTKDTDLKNELIANNSNHWMVKQFEIQ